MASAGPASEFFEVCFLPSGLRGTVARGTPLREAARSLGLEIESLCGGRAACGKCQVRVLEGESAGHVSALSDAEARARAAGRLGVQERFSCQARVEGALAIYVPEASRVGRPIVRKSASERECALAPAIHKYFVELEPARVGEPRRVHRPPAQLVGPLRPDAEPGDLGPYLKFLSALTSAQHDVQEGLPQPAFIIGISGPSAPHTAGPP